MEKHSRKTITFLLERAEDILLKEEMSFAKWISQKKVEQDNFDWQLERLNKQFKDYSQNLERKALDIAQYQNLLNFDIRVHKVYDEWKTKYETECAFKNKRLLALRSHVKKWEAIISRIDARDEAELYRLEAKLADEIANNMWMRQRAEKEQETT